ncbi:XRE family transcriptional regulator [Amycolatopsis mediterranei S699]|uniref:XRE family transcriptional regulator n=3 Tax=Amycolatopsis mediterranei TaxID=33910 RepID=A0A0H3DAF4_AMYMU|nr:helix-turn-helix domain-containing protein [Amycolatopsis mediterranei]ADJ46524.1 XRE family transcriptional regulator [Amycolatopsis mediterranei U32]AEK43324.1 XRE family transcriptional regulator [Amycolatopsis mediterranei S699]AFO78235.1 XRE family transcriptional regulator [Amycolatopsis mediterranei S699]AGT85363.1 XRE family transcriptional regulator [Amycolatopsis mediterranei RB]KDO06181.1 XRE family transcriptional regulator [Amycolatopsis mediterranei]
MTEDFGRLLRAHRRLSALTQLQLADLSTLSVRAIRDLEQGRAQRPRPNTVRLLADGLELRGSRRAAFEAAANAGDAAVRALAAELHCTDPPAAMNALLGREQEVRVLADLVLVDRHRVVTVTGIAGVGKTRLAIEVAGHVAESGLRVLWKRCDRGPLPGPELLRTAELAGDRDVLLVLDGIAVPAPDLPILELLRRCPRLRVLVTSDAPLNQGEERVAPLTPLPVPEAARSGDLLAVGRSPSVRLLLRHIRALNPAFRLGDGNVRAIAEICRRCDGHPRAVEVAGIWCALWSPHQVCAQLAQDPIALPRPAATGMEIPGLTAALYRSLAALGVRERQLLVRLLPLRSAWSVEEVSALTGGEPAETTAVVHNLVLRGLVRGDDRPGGTEFEVLNLVRSCVAGRPEPLSV